MLLPKEINILYDVVNDGRYVSTDKYKLTLSTVYSSKGLEFEEFIIIGNDYNLLNSDDRYLHYVDVSRPGSTSE